MLSLVQYVFGFTEYISKNEHVCCHNSDNVGEGALPKQCHVDDGKLCSMGKCEQTKKGSVVVTFSEDLGGESAYSSPRKGNHTLTKFTLSSRAFQLLNGASPYLCAEFAFSSSTPLPHCYVLLRFSFTNAFNSF